MCVFNETKILPQPERELEVRIPNSQRWYIDRQERPDRDGKHRQPGVVAEVERALMRLVAVGEV
eukprot:COSAG06_NODE_3507_length_5257_cov_7.932144_4_plen_64_part_00